LLEYQNSRLLVLAALLLAATLAAIPPVPTRSHWDAWCDYHTPPTPPMF
jgi:hypothetical protein